MSDRDLILTLLQVTLAPQTWLAQQENMVAALSRLTRVATLSDVQMHLRNSGRSRREGGFRHCWLEYELRSLELYVVKIASSRSTGLCFLDTVAYVI